MLRQDPATLALASTNRQTSAAALTALCCHSSCSVPQPQVHCPPPQYYGTPCVLGSIPTRQARSFQEAPPTANLCPSPCGREHVSAVIRPPPRQPIDNTVTTCRSINSFPQVGCQACTYRCSGALPMSTRGGSRAANLSAGQAHGFCPALDKTSVSEPLDSGTITGPR